MDYNNDTEPACACGTGLPAPLCCAWSAVPAPAGLPPSNDAAAALEAGEVARAERLAMASLRQFPGNLDALTILVLVRDKTGGVDASLALLKRMARLDPDLFWVKARLAARLLQAGRPADAEPYARDTIRLNPVDASAHHVLARVFAAQCRFAAAEYHCRRAIDLSGGDAMQFADLASSVAGQGRLDEARALYEQSVALDPGVFQVWYGWARAEQAAGHLSLARERLEQALRLEPSNGAARLMDAALRARQGAAPEALRRLEDLARQGEPGILPDAALEQGRILDLLGRHDEAYAAFERGKRLLRERGRGYRQDAAALQEKRLKNFFVAPRLRLLPTAAPAPGPQPVFICGAPRSGAALLDRMLSRHAGIGGRAQAGALADAVAEAPRLLGSALAYPEALAELWMGDRHDALDRLRDVYLRGARRGAAMARDTPYFTDRMPFGETHLGLVGLLFPYAPVVHMLRHPLDVVLSMFSRDMAHGMDCAMSLETTAREYARVADLVAHYRAEMPLRYLSVRYEDIVRDPRLELRRLAAFLGLPDDPACVDGDAGAAAGRVAGQEPAAHALYDDACHRYRRYRRYLEPVVAILERAINAQGYSVGPWEDTPA